MKKIILLSLTGILFILVSFFSCNKENTELTQTTVVKPNPDSCATVSSKGRIIGFDYCYNFMSAQKVMGAGFIIEIDNGATRDTALTYGIPDSLFQFLPSDRVDGMFPYLFKPDVQNKFKIKFNYTFTSNNTFHNYDCNVPANIQLPPLFSFRRKEILITCISPL